MSNDACTQVYLPWKGVQPPLHATRWLALGLKRRLEEDEGLREWLESAVMRKALDGGSKSRDLREW